MAKLDGSIFSFKSLKGSIKAKNIISGTIRKTYLLAGSVAEFTRSLSARLIIKPAVVIYTKANLFRVARANIKNEIGVFAKAKAYRNAISSILFETNIYIKGSVFKNGRVSINVNPIFGKKTTLGELDSFTLDDLDSLTLGEIEFSEGVIGTIVRNSKMNIINVASLQVTAYTLRYTKLNDVDSLTLGTLDSLTLQEIEEQII